MADLVIFRLIRQPNHFDDVCCIAPYPSYRLINRNLHRLIEDMAKSTNLAIPQIRQVTKSISICTSRLKIWPKRGTCIHVEFLLVLRVPCFFYALLSTITFANVIWELSILSFNKFDSSSVVFGLRKRPSVISSRDAAIFQKCMNVRTDAQIRILSNTQHLHY